MEGKREERIANENKVSNYPNISDNYSFERSQSFLFDESNTVNLKESQESVEVVTTPFKRKFVVPVVPSNDKKMRSEEDDENKENIPPANPVLPNIFSVVNNENIIINNDNDINMDPMKDVLDNAVEEEIIEREIDKYSEFYDVFKDDYRFDISKKNYKNLINPRTGAGNMFRKYIESNNTPLIAKLVQIVLERKKMSYYYTKIQNSINSKDSDKKRFFLKFVNDSKNVIDELDIEYFKYKEEIHHKRYLHLFYYFKKQYNFIISDVRSYDNVKTVYLNYFKNLDI